MKCFHSVYSIFTMSSSTFTFRLILQIIFLDNLELPLLAALAVVSPTHRADGGTAPEQTTDLSSH